MAKIRVAAMVVLATAASVSAAVNVAPSATATASSAYGPGYTAEGVNDGVAAWQPGNAWCSGETAEPHWVQLTWADPVLIGEVTVDHIGAGNSAYAALNTADYLVQTWDGSDWITNASVIGNTANTTVSIFDAVTTTQLRLYVTKAAQMDGGDYDMARILEIGAAVPEPMTVALLGLGGLLVRRRT